MTMETEVSSATDDQDIPDILTFAQARDLIADDMAQLASQFSDAEKQCREGDVEAALRAISSMGTWSMMLLVRYDDRMERVDAGREKKRKRRAND